MTKGSNGHAELVDTIREIAVGTQPRIDVAAYGTIDAGGNLLVDQFAHVFEPGAYGFLLRDTLPDPMTITTFDGGHTGHAGHTHGVVRPAALIPFLLVPGCRVEVLWNYQRTRPFVVGIVG